VKHLKIHSQIFKKGPLGCQSCCDGDFSPIPFYVFYLIGHLKLSSNRLTSSL